MAIQAPFGDIFLYQSPHTDQALNHLYQEQRYREVNQQRENAGLDQMMQREFGKVRSIDSSEIINGYQQYKDLKNQLYNNPKIRRDPQAYNQVKRQADLALQNVYQGINRSQELLNMAKQDDAQRTRNPNNYDDNYGTMRAEFWNTPMSQLPNSQHGDLSNPDTYLYKGQNTDWQKGMTASMGTPKPSFSFEEKVGDKGLQTKITPYSFGNSPAQVKESLLGFMGQHKAGRDAEYAWDQLTPEQIETTRAQYLAIPQDKWTKMGLQGPQDLAPRNPQSKAEQYASYLAMQYAINNEPRAGTPQFKTDIGAVEDYKQKGRLYMEAVKQGNRQALVNMRHDYKLADKAAKTKMENGVYDLIIENALKNPVPTTDNGVKKTEYQIEASPDVVEMFDVSDADGKKVHADAVRLSPDKQYVYSIVYKRDENGEIEKNKAGWNQIDHRYSKRILEPEFKARVIKGLFGAKEAKEQTSEEDDTRPVSQPEKPKVESSDHYRNKYKY